MIDNTLEFEESGAGKSERLLWQVIISSFVLSFNNSHFVILFINVRKGASKKLDKVEGQNLHLYVVSS